MRFIWLLRASNWARNPPSAKRLALIAIVAAICLGLYGIEYFWGWPEWLTPERRGRVLR